MKLNNSELQPTLEAVCDKLFRLDEKLKQLEIAGKDLEVSDYINECNKVEDELTEIENRFRRVEELKNKVSSEEYLSMKLQTIDEKNIALEKQTALKRNNRYIEPKGYIILKRDLTKQRAELINVKHRLEQTIYNNSNGII